MTEPRLQIRDLWLTSPEPTFRAPQEGTIRTVTPTTMTTTTLVASNLTSAYVGMYVVPEDGAIRGQTRQIKSWNSSTNTGTVDTAWSSTASVTTLRIWSQPNPAVVADSGTSTSVTDATHGSVTNEPDDYYNEDHLIAMTGANAGGAFKINDFSTTGGVFDLTGDAPGTTTAPGDLYLGPVWLVRSEAQVTGVVERGTISRRVTGRKEADQAVPIAAHGSVEFTLPQRPLTAGASGAAVPPKDTGRYLRDVMTQTLDTGSTYSSTTGSTPGTIVTNVASGTGFTIGGFILLATGEASGISNKSTNALTTPHRTAAAPIASSVAYASAWYQAKETDYRTRTFYGFRGGIHRQNFHGCAPTIQIKISRDQLVTFAFKYTAASASEWALSSPFNNLASHRMSLVDTTVPVDGKGARLLIDYIPCFVSEVTIDLGIMPVPRASLSGMDQQDGFAFNMVPTKYTFSGYLADNDETSGMVGLQDRLAKGSVIDLFYQKGSAPAETFCAWAPAASITKSVCAIDNEQLVFNAEAEVVLPQVARGNSAAATLPPSMIGWL